MQEVINAGSYEHDRRNLAWNPHGTSQFRRIMPEQSRLHYSQASQQKMQSTEQGKLSKVQLAELY
jgi:hypothetical protein